MAGYRGSLPGRAGAACSGRTLILTPGSIGNRPCLSSSGRDCVHVVVHAVDPLELSDRFESALAVRAGGHLALLASDRLERVEHDPFEQLAQRDAVKLRQPLQDLDHPLLHAHAELYTFHRKRLCLACHRFPPRAQPSTNGTMGPWYHTMLAPEHMAWWPRLSALIPGC